MCVTLVQVGSIPFEAGLSLLLGANFGSAMIPVSLSRGLELSSRRSVFANLFLRGVWSLLILFAINMLPELWGRYTIGAGAQTLITTHNLLQRISSCAFLAYLPRTRTPVRVLFTRHQTRRYG